MHCCRRLTGVGIVVAAATARCGYGKKETRLASTARCHPSLWVSGVGPRETRTPSSMGEWRCWDCAGLAETDGLASSGLFGGRGWMARRGVVSRTWRCRDGRMGGIGFRGSDLEVCCGFAEFGSIRVVDLNSTVFFV